MRLTNFDVLPGLKGAMTRGRPFLHIARGKGRAAFGSMTPVWDRLAGKVQEQPWLAAPLGALSKTWARLVESFAATIDPYISRYFPDTRLLALLTTAGAVELHSVVQGTVTTIGALAEIDASGRSELAKRKWTAIELRMRPDQLLQRTLSLPAASRDFLGPIIEHKLERLTPWRPERVLYGHQVVGESETGGGVSVQLVATSKDFVTAPLQELAEAGLVPTAIGPASDTNLADPLRINLLRDAATGARADSRRIVSRIALTTFGLLAFVYVGSVFWSSIASDQQREAGVRLIKARRLLKTASMGAVGDHERALLEAKQPERSMVVLVDKIAAAIPDDTYLKEFSVTPVNVRLVGTSGNAPTLIGKLEATGLIKVRFAAAVTRGKNQKDSFEITADRTSATEGEPR